MTQNELNLAGTFAAELVKVLESTTGERPTFEIGAPVDEVDPDAFAWHQEFTGGPLQAAWIAAERTGAQELGGKLLRAAGIEEYDQQEAANTYLETLTQALSSFTRTVGARDGQEVNCSEGHQSPCPPDDALVPIRLTFPGGSAVSVYARFREKETPQPDVEPLPPSTLETESLRNLDLLLDVELPVTISVGRAQLPLKDVVKLTTGSTIELNRKVSEPVEVIVNNCVIAKGEVVVVDGNFAVRIDRVVSRQDRLRTIG